MQQMLVLFCRGEPTLFFGDLYENLNQKNQQQKNT